MIILTYALAVFLSAERQGVSAVYMSEYSELIKNYNKIRDYMRDFYVYGFRSRENYTGKSNRSYDNEKRRIESYLGDIIAFHNGDDGKKVFLTMDSSELLCNPFFKSFKTKSFTKNDITLHFAVVYILKKYGKLSLNEISNYLYSEIMSFFENYDVIDIATIRNKLKEYVGLGIVKVEKVNAKTLYSLVESPDILELFDAICFYSENFPLGIVGSFILDRFDEKNSVFTTKHKYILDVVDSEIIFDLAQAIYHRAYVEIEEFGYRQEKIKTSVVLPLKIAITAQSGRNYLMCQNDVGAFKSLRLDGIKSVKRRGGVCAEFDELSKTLDERLKNTWGVYLGGSNKLSWLKLYLKIEENEGYILNRLQKEGRGGKVERVSDNVFCFSIELYDLDEIRPWLRTFIGRIEKLECSKSGYVERFFADVDAMKNAYGGLDQ
ncbi:MAG: WYL domain-containing protein [Clostridia bacterium]